MYSILLVVEKPNKESAFHKSPYDNWRSMITNLRNKHIDIEVFAENVILLPLNQNLTPLGEILEALHGLTYKYSIFDEEIKWCEVEFVEKNANKT